MTARRAERSHSKKKKQISLKVSFKKLIKGRKKAGVIVQSNRKAKYRRVSELAMLIRVGR